MLQGYGTEKLNEKVGDALFKYAYEVGYRIFDTALAYGNLKVIGKVLHSINDRHRIRLISKIALPDIEKYSTRVCLEMILRELRTEYIDVLLIHAPKGVNHEKTFTEMLELQNERKILKCGVSNYTIRHLDQLAIKGIVPQVTQIEIHPYLCELNYVNFCIKKNIEIMAHTSLANGRLINDPTLARLSSELNCTIPQLAISWSISRGLIPITSSLKPSHIQDNMNLVVEKLNDNIITKINSLNTNLRICNNPEWGEFS
jgi:diketogulonate reductase-like aldo/keto reductase